MKCFQSKVHLLPKLSSANRSAQFPKVQLLLWESNESCIIFLCPFSLQPSPFLMPSPRPPTLIHSLSVFWLLLLNTCMHLYAIMCVCTNTSQPSESCFAVSAHMVLGDSILKCCIFPLLPLSSLSPAMPLIHCLPNSWPIPITHMRTHTYESK